MESKLQVWKSKFSFKVFPQKLKVMKDPRTLTFKYNNRKGEVCNVIITAHLKHILSIPLWPRVPFTVWQLSFLPLHTPQLSSTTVESNTMSHPTICAKKDKLLMSFFLGSTINVCKPLFFYRSPFILLYSWFYSENIEFKKTAIMYLQDIDVLSSSILFYLSLSLYSSYSTPWNSSSSLQTHFQNFTGQ